MSNQIVAFVITALTATMASGQPSTQQSTVVYVANGEAPRNLQEMASIFRVIGGVRQVYTDTAKSAVAVSGTTDQIALAQWLANELDRPASGSPPVNSSAHEYRIPGSSDDVVRVFSISHSANPQNLQEIATVIRTIADIPRAFTYAAPPALAVRGTAAQIALSAWLIDDLDKPASSQTPASSEPHEYRMPDTNVDVVRVFYLAPSETQQNLQKVAAAVRTATKAPRLFTNSDQKAIVMRGTPDQIATAERLISEVR